MLSTKLIGDQVSPSEPHKTAENRQPVNMEDETGRARDKR